MRFAWKIALCVSLFSGCTATRQSIQVQCSRDAALARGIKDGATGRKARFSFLHSCTDISRANALSAYREGFESSRPKRKEDVLEIEIVEDAEEAPGEFSAQPVSVTVPSGVPTPTSVTSTVRGPSAIAWVCEVEANSKVFTGVGLSREEALGSARATCGAHFQASYCTKADCKQNL